jgi:perosamine synthetase
MNRINLAVPALGGSEERYVLDALRSTWISSTGPYVRRFEHEFATLCGTRAAISVVNGTAALHLVMLALNVGPGDEVIVPSLTYIATANAVNYTGATPVFADVSSDTWCLDPGAVEAAVTSRTRGIIAVDLYGHPADMDALNAVASRNGLWVVEDAAEAHGARYRGRPAGSLGTVGVFSFYGNKVITSGEGGAVTVDDPELEQRIRLIRGQGMDPNRRYWFPIVGYNYRLTNIACAILCAQLERFDDILMARRSVFDGYRHRLSNIPGIGFQPVADWAEAAPWLFCITVDRDEFGLTRDELAMVLDEAGVETRPFFHPLHRLPPYERDDGPFLPVTDMLSATGINLPTFVGLTDDDLDRIASVIEGAQQARQVG